MTNCNENSATLTMFADLGKDPQEPFIVDVRFVVRYCTQQPAEYFEGHKQKQLSSGSVARTRSEHRIIWVLTSSPKSDHCISEWKKLTTDKLISLISEEFKRELSSGEVDNLIKTVEELREPNKIRTSVSEVSFSAIQGLL